MRPVGNRDWTRQITPGLTRIQQLFQNLIIHRHLFTPNYKNEQLNINLLEIYRKRRIIFNIFLNKHCFLNHKYYIFMQY